MGTLRSCAVGSNGVGRVCANGTAFFNATEKCDGDFAAQDTRGG